MILTFWSAPPLLATFAIVFTLLGAERLYELILNRRHTRALRALGARWMTDDGFRNILAAQALLFIMLPAEVLLAPWPATGWWTWILLAIALGAQVLRYWCITTLGDRWSIRVVTVPGASRITRGPYRFLRHPNYVAVAVEALAIPLAFGAIATAGIVFPLQLLALKWRVMKEDHALDEAEMSGPA